MRHEKSTVAAYILWLMLGIFGAHKFYLRQPLMGVVYFFTAGLLLIGWFIDLFTLPDQVAECNEEIFLRSEYDEDMDILEDRIDELEEEVSYLRSKLGDSSSSNI